MTSKNHIIIIGGTRGSGLHFTKRKLKKRYMVTTIGRKPDFNIENSSYNEEDFNYLSVNFHDAESVKKAINIAIKKFGVPSELVFFQRYRGDDEWDGEIQVSITITNDVINVLVNEFKIKNLSIVVVLSNASRIIVHDQPVSYHVCKGALEQLIRYYAVNLGPEGIRVNGISPSTVIKKENKKYYNSEGKTKMKYLSSIIPLRRMGTSRDVCDGIDFLLGKQSKFITGQIISIDGGASLMSNESITELLHNEKFL